MSDIASTLTAAVDSGLAGVVAAVTKNCETIFDGAAGVRTLGESVPMTVDTVVAIYSMTKAITGAAAMQLVERGQLSLDEPAGRYLAELADAQVLTGFDPDGAPLLRPAANPVTLRHVLTHTSGFVYDMWNADLARYGEVAGLPPLTSLQKQALRVPLAFEPGTRWDYGTGLDWAGLMVEEVTGQTLGQFCAENLFGPLGMSDTGFAPTDTMAQRAASIHLRTPDGIVPFALPAPEAPEFEMGGGGLLSTVSDYLKFANMILGGGSLSTTRVLNEATVVEMSRNNIGDIDVAPLVTVNPMLTCDADFWPGMQQKWGLSFLINTEVSPQGRPAGSLAWAGLANSYYWIDPVNNVCGVWATQLFPFFDPAAIGAFRAFESATYASLAG